jgi:hypothetical protein
MGQPTVQQVVQDPDFIGLPANERVKVLQRIDPDFAGLPKGEQLRAASRFGAPQSPAVDEAGVQSRPGMPAPRIPTALGGNAKGLSRGVDTDPVNRFLTASYASAADAVPGMVKSVVGGAPNAAVQGFQQAYQSWRNRNQPQAPGAEQLAGALGINSERIKEAAQADDKVGIAAEATVPILSALTLSRMTGASKMGPESPLPGARTARAAQSLNQVESVAGKVPISTEPVMARAGRIQEMVNAGESMPQVVRKFLRRVGDAEKGPITLKEARDFYSSATGRLSMEQMAKLSGRMQRELGIFTTELNKAITAAAETEGMGQQYGKAIKDYATGAKWQRRMGDAGDFAKKAAVKGALGATMGAGGLAGYNIYRALMGDD